MDGPVVAVDCEGVRLGRFGRVCVVQLATSDGRLFIFDALRPGVVQALKPMLESHAVAKVLHDCREDSAAFYHQHGIRLRTVFDTQAAHAVLLRRSGRPAHQASFQELLSRRLGLQEPPEIGEVKSLMLEDSRLWARRPLTSLLVRYVLHGVSELLPLRASLLADAADAAGEAGLLACARASQRSSDYCLLNGEFPSAASMAKIGTRLWAYIASHTDAGVFFKLNAGRVGIANTPSAIRRFADVALGDAVLCCVSGVSLDGTYLYLDRYDHDWDYFDHQMRPAAEPEVGAFGREIRHRPSLFEGDASAGATPADPLLVRGLPSDEVGGGLDAWEAGHDDLGLPAELDDY